MGFGMPDATVWAWGRKGRPTAFLKLELYPNFFGRSIWSFGFTSLSSGPVAAEYEGQRRWSPTKPGFEPRPLPDVPPPAEKPAQRLRQMRDLARRFAAYRIWGLNDQRTELRLLSQPLRRYDDAETGLLDGTVFGLAKDTNPNILLLIEATAADDSRAHWQYALVRNGDAEYHVEFDGREVWEAPERACVDPLGPFHWFHRPALLDAAPDERCHLVARWQADRVFERPRIDSSLCLRPITRQVEMLPQSVGGG